MYASALSSFAHSNSKYDTLINLKRQSAFLQIAFSVNLGVHPSTVYRELKRNAKKNEEYSARCTEQLYQEGSILKSVLLLSLKMKIQGLGSGYFDRKRPQTRHINDSGTKKLFYPIG
jgi:hypothetical protein